MPLSCDCYGGCWGDHSKGWPSVPQPRDPHAVARKAGVPHGSYVIVEQGLRLETEAYRDAVMAVLNGARGSEGDKYIGRTVESMQTEFPQARPSMSFAAFANANRERCESPQGFKHKLSDWTSSDWMTALVGEVGEAANVVKKLNRYRDGINGNTEAEDALRNKLRKELGDVFVYLDLMAQSLGFRIEDAATEVFNSKSAEIGYPETL